MKIENLSQENVNDLTDFLDEMQKVNPSVAWDTYPMGDPTGPAVNPTSVPVDLTGLHRGVYNPTIEQLDELKEAVAALDRKLDLIFGGHVVMNNQFVKFT